MNDRRPNEEHNRTDVLDQLRDPVPAPDLTRRIMGRLGYMRATSRAVRRQRRRVAIRRAALALVGLTAIAVGVEMHNRSPEARRPDAVTIPTAIRNDLGRQQERLDNVFRAFRNLAPRHGRSAEIVDPPDNVAPMPELPPEILDREDVRVAVARVT